MSKVLDSVCPLDCPDTCSLSVTVDDGKVVRVDGSHRNPYTDGFICAKVRRYPERIYGHARLRTPLARVGRKGEGRFEPIAWDQAIDQVAERLAAIRDESGGDAILPYHYGGSNGLLGEEGADSWFFNRLGACHLEKTVCAAPTGAVSQALYGSMVGVPPTDYPHAKLILLWGVNPAVTSIHLRRQVQQAQRNGAHIVVVDPLRTRTARSADTHLRPRPGTDVVLALALAQHLAATERLDTGFIEQHVDGAEAFLATAAEYPPDRAAEVCGVAADDIRALAERYADSAPALIRCGWGVERNRNGGNAVRAILALPALAGKFGVRAGGYTLSLSRAFAIDREALSGSALRARPARSVNMTRLGRALTELSDPPIRALFVYNSNALATTPDQNRILRGLQREDLFTVVHDQVMTDTARYADIVLPATTSFEHAELHKSYGHTVLQYAPKVIEPEGEAIDNIELFRRLGAAMDFSEVASMTEDTLVDAALAGSDAAPRVRMHRAVEMRFGGSDRVVQFGSVHPHTPKKRVRLMAEELGPLVYRPEARDALPLVLLSPASDRRVNSTFGEFNPAASKLTMHPDDAFVRGITDGDVVRVCNDHGEVHVPARVDDDVPPGVTVLPKGIWRASTVNGATGTALVSDDLTDIGGGACFNDARVEVEPVAGRTCNGSK